MILVEIFKTNVNNKRDATKMIKKLSFLESGYIVNFDLDDCDRILRIESNKKININSVIKLLKENNFNCEILN